MQDYTEIDSVLADAEAMFPDIAAMPANRPQGNEIGDAPHRANADRPAEEQQPSGDAHQPMLDDEDGIPGADDESSQELARSTRTQKKQGLGPESHQVTASEVQMTTRFRRFPEKDSSLGSRTPSPSKVQVRKVHPKTALPDAQPSLLRLLTAGSLADQPQLDTLDVPLLSNGRRNTAQKWFTDYPTKKRWTAWWRNNGNCGTNALYLKSSAAEQFSKGMDCACDKCITNKRPCIRVFVGNDAPIPVILPQAGKAGPDGFSYWP